MPEINATHYSNIAYLDNQQKWNANRTWNYTEGCAALDLKALFSPAFHNKMKHKDIFHRGSP